MNDYEVAPHPEHNASRNSTRLNGEGLWSRACGKHPSERKTTGANVSVKSWCFSLFILTKTTEIWLFSNFSIKKRHCMIKWY